MKYFLLTIFILTCKFAFGQNEVSESTNKVYKEFPVKRHKRKLELTLIIDSIKIADKTFKANTLTTEKVKYETGYIKINDSLFIKVFISRNEEYGKKFYSWKWDYLKKGIAAYQKLGSSFYSPIFYKSDYYFEVGGMGQGIGIEGSSGYLMIYYKYKLK